MPQLQFQPGEKEQIDQRQTAFPGSMPFEDAYHAFFGQGGVANPAVGSPAMFFAGPSSAIGSIPGAVSSGVRGLNTMMRGSAIPAVADFNRAYGQAGAINPQQVIDAIRYGKSEASPLGRVTTPKIDAMQEYSWGNNSPVTDRLLKMLSDPGIAKWAEREWQGVGGQGLASLERLGAPGAESAAFRVRPPGGAGGSAFKLSPVSENGSLTMENAALKPPAAAATLRSGTSPDAIQVSGYGGKQVPYNLGFYEQELAPPFMGLNPIKDDKARFVHQWGPEQSIKFIEDIKNQTVPQGWNVFDTGLGANLGLNRAGQPKVIDLGGMRQVPTSPSGETNQFMGSSLDELIKKIQAFGGQK